jgi:Domain of unknown function (DUF6398)
LKKDINPEKAEQNYKQILALVQDFCAKKLNEHYFAEAEGLAKKLSRKRAKPLAAGKPEIWAAAIIYTLAHMNFLFDKSSEFYISADDISTGFGTKKSTVSTKSRLICDLLKLSRFDNMMAHFMNDMEDRFVMVDDYYVPINSLPQEYQLMVKDARAKGEDITFRSK